MKTVLAKQRKLEDMPEWAKCCPWLIAELKKIVEMDLTLEVAVDWSVLPFQWCKGCGSRTPNVQVRKIVAPRERAGMVIPVSFFEFDEGLVANAAT